MCLKFLYFVFTLFFLTNIGAKTFTDGPCAKIFLKLYPNETKCDNLTDPEEVRDCRLSIVAQSTLNCIDEKNIEKRNNCAENEIKKLANTIPLYCLKKFTPKFSVLVEKKEIQLYGKSSTLGSRIRKIIVDKNKENN